MKKKFLFLFMLGTSVALTSCDKIKEATNQDVTITPEAVNFTIPIITNTAAVTKIGEFSLNVDLDAKIKEKASKFGIKNIKSIKVSSVTVSLNNSDDNNNFGNMETLEGSISADNQTSQVAVKVANNPATAASTITLPANGNIELKSLVTGANIKYTFNGKMRKATTKALEARATVKYELVVGL